MIIKLTSGATVQTLCDGYGYRGQTGYNVGPTNLSGIDIAWLARQPITPLRATNAIPQRGYNQTTRIGFSVTRLFDTEESAWEWAYYTFPAALLPSGTLGLYVTAKKHCDLANAVIISPLRIVPSGVSVDIDFAFEGGAMTFVTDP
jgi:hypothetical protein